MSLLERAEHSSKSTVQISPRRRRHANKRVRFFDMICKDADSNAALESYYILRQEMLKIYVDELVATLDSRGPNDGWEVSHLYCVVLIPIADVEQSAEAILHCIMSVQEAVELAPNTHLERLFGPEATGRLPRTGYDRVRKTALSLIG